MSDRLGLPERPDRLACRRIDGGDLPARPHERKESAAHEHGGRPKEVVSVGAEIIPAPDPRNTELSEVARVDLIERRGASVPGITPDVAPFPVFRPRHPLHRLARRYRQRSGHGNAETQQDTSCAEVRMSALVIFTAFYPWMTRASGFDQSPDKRFSDSSNASRRRQRKKRAVNRAHLKKRGASIGANDLWLSGGVYDDERGACKEHVVRGDTEDECGRPTDECPQHGHDNHGDWRATGRREQESCSEDPRRTRHTEGWGGWIGVPGQNVQRRICQGVKRKPDAEPQRKAAGRAERQPSVHHTVRASKPASPTKSAAKPHAAGLMLAKYVA